VTRERVRVNEKQCRCEEASSSKIIIDNKKRSFLGSPQTIIHIQSKIFREKFRGGGGGGRIRRNSVQWLKMIFLLLYKIERERKSVV
jgi:hypothetical protein